MPDLKVRPTYERCSVPQRLSGLQRERNPRLCFRLAAQTEKGFSFESQQVVFCRMRGVGEVAARENPCEFPANQRVVIADAGRAMREVNTQSQHSKEVSAADRYGGPPRRRLVSFR